MKQKQKLILFFLLGLVPSQLTQAQGFTTLQDKYGASSAQPLQQKQAPVAGQAAATGATEQAVPDGMLMLNGVDVEIKDMIKLIANVTGKNFILNDKVRGKITIISEKPLSYDMAYQAFLSALEINGFTIVETPAGLLNIIPQKDSLQKPLDLFKDNSPVTDKFITRIIQLSNISANEISQILKPMVSKNGSLLAYPTTNSLIITDAGSNIDYLLKLLKELDQEGPQEVLEIIPIINADAKDIADKVMKIFEDESAKNNQAVRRFPVRRPYGAAAEMEDVQAISKVIADERTNSIIIMGTKRSILKVKALIARLDRTVSGVEGMIHVFYLRNANAKDIADVMSNLVSDSKKGGDKAKAAKAGEATLELQGGVKVTADENTNSLIITASPKDFTTLVEKVISKLDIVRPQIYLEAVIMALDVNKSSSFGFSGNGGANNFLPSSGTTLSAFGALLPTASTAISSIAGASGGFAGGMFSSDSINFTLADGSSVSIPAISGILQALQSDTDVNVLSTPSILTLDNEEATIQVGQEVPVQSGTTVSTGVTSFNVTREDVGIILKITPQISESDTVRLKITQEISSVLPNPDPNLGPTFDKKSVETVVVAKNRQTIVIGGLIDDTTAIATQKVPLLGDIPVLGSLFRNRTTQKTKSNLIVFITPYVIRERGDYLAILKKKIEERNAFVNNNYGASQRKLIRNAIQNHAADLLEFKCDLADLSNPCLTEGVLPETSRVDSKFVEPGKSNYSQSINVGVKSKRRRGKVR